MDIRRWRIFRKPYAGCAFLDYDNDGWMDIYLVNSGPCDFYQPPQPLRNALYHNNRDGTFTDITQKAGVPGNAASNGSGRRRLRWRWLSGHLPYAVSTQRPLSQQRGWYVYRCHSKSRRRRTGMGYQRRPGSTHDNDVSARICSSAASSIYSKASN